MMKKINVSIAGYGMAVKTFHLPVLSCIEEIDVKKLYSPSIKNTDGLYSSIEKTANINSLMTPEIDLIVIATPNHTHYELAKLFLENEKNVVVEKPFTVTSSQAQELEELALKKHLLLSVHHNRRWDGPFLTVEKIIKNNTIGTITYFESHFDRFRPQVRDRWKESSIQGAGILYDLGPHLIDQALHLFGMPQKIYADIQMQRKDSKSPDFFEIKLFYPHMNVVLKAGMLVNYPTPHFLLFADKGTFIKYGYDTQEALLNNGLTPCTGKDWGKDKPENYGLIRYFDGDEEKIETVAGSYTQYYKDIYISLITGKDPQITAKDGRNTIFIIEKAIISSQEQQILTL